MCAYTCREAGTQCEGMRSNTVPDRLSATRPSSEGRTHPTDAPRCTPEGGRSSASSEEGTDSRGHVCIQRWLWRRGRERKAREARGRRRQRQRQGQRHRRRWLQWTRPSIAMEATNKPRLKQSGSASVCKTLHERRGCDGARTARSRSEPAGYATPEVITQPHGRRERGSFRRCRRERTARATCRRARAAKGGARGVTVEPAGPHARTVAPAPEPEPRRSEVRGPKSHAC